MPVRLPTPAQLRAGPGGEVRHAALHVVHRRVFRLPGQHGRGGGQQQSGGRQEEGSGVFQEERSGRGGAHLPDIHGHERGHLHAAVHQVSFLLQLFFFKF